MNATESEVVYTPYTVIRSAGTQEQQRGGSLCQKSSIVKQATTEKNTKQPVKR